MWWWWEPALTIASHIGSQQGIMVWGVISFDNRTHLVVISVTVTARHSTTSYATVSFATPGLTFQYDNAQAHTVRVAMNSLQACPTFFLGRPDHPISLQ